MAIKVVKSGKAASMADMLAAYKKDMGEEIGSYGGRLLEAERIPTGLFPLDLALGGGFPRGKATIIFGPESSSKTNLALLAIGNHQKRWPEQTCAFVDVERSFDPAWARLLGVDTDKLIVVEPAYAEQVVDIVEGFLAAIDCGVVVVDSLAAMIPISEVENSAERANVGTAGLVINKLYRKSTAAMGESIKRGGFPTLIYINQIRFKIGVMFGNPETMPGGPAMLFQAAIILRVYGKNVTDPKVSDTMPVAKEVQFVIKKWKCPIHSAGGKFEMIMLPYKGLQPGQCDDLGLLQEYLEGYGEWGKGPKDKGWVIAGETYDTQAAWKQRVLSDQDYAKALRRRIIVRELDGELVDEGEA